MNCTEIMENPNIDLAKVKALILYIVGKTGTIDFHKFFKILYFAEQHHLVNYGRKIVNDSYVAMQYGPVASEIYNIFNEKRKNTGYRAGHEEILNSIVINEFEISVSEKPDMDELSVSDINCIDRSIEENAHLTMNERTIKSHKLAWKKAKCKSNGNGNLMDDLDIARDGGASEWMLNYISKSKSISLMLQ
jgi:uncharacterized phage-associated protein